ncbi:MAG: IclR family transcriptional regulator [Pseudoclavibacter sp.]
MTEAPSASDPRILQTLSRGIRVIELLSEAGRSLTIDQIAVSMDLHRSVVYRLIRTLEEHGLLVRDISGGFGLGVRLAALAAGVVPDLQSAAVPELTAIANDLGATCFLTVLDRGECITLTSVEPRHSVALIAQRPGTRHPVTAGAPGLAILSTFPADQLPADLTVERRKQVDLARERGFATSQNEVLPGLMSVAVPLALRNRDPAALAVVQIEEHLDLDHVAGRLLAGAADIRGALGMGV